MSTSTVSSNGNGSAPVAPALEFRAVGGGYGRAKVVHDVDIVVPPGVVVALLGPNGAGKTTLLRMAAGLLSNAEGAILLGGEDISKRSPDRRARAGLCLIPEGRGIFRGLTVRENLQMQVPRGSDVDIAEAVDVFPVLGQRMRQTAGTMSGGEQQMLALARSYLSRPSVVLLDEVSMGLSPRIVQQIFESFDRLTARGVALLIVEQYIGQALSMAQTAYLLNRGAVAWSGNASELGADEVARRYLGMELESFSG